MIIKLGFFTGLLLIAIYFMFYHQYTYCTSIEVFSNGWIEEARFPVVKQHGIFYCQKPQTFKNVQVGHTDWATRILERKEIIDKQFADVRLQCHINLT